MKVILVDAMNLIKRQQHTHQELASSDGDETGILHGVLSNVLFFNKMFPEHAMVFAFEGGRTWRHELSDEYKANREAHELEDQLKQLRDTLDIFGIKNVSMDGFEADDIIGFLTTGLVKNGAEVLIYSSDKDFFQLITDKVKVVRRDKSNVAGYAIVTSKDVIEKFGVHPKDWTKMRAFCGDTSDNLKPVPGIGGKTALKILGMGVDPSQPKFSQRTAIIAPQLRQHWNKIHECYVLSCILREVDDNHVKEESREQLSKMINGVTKDPYRAKFTEKQMDDRTEMFIQFARKYDLMYLLSQRHSFWKIH